MIFVPLRQDVELLEEGLVVAAFDLVVGIGVDLGHVLGQLQGHAQDRGVELEMLLGLGQGVFGGLDFALYPLPLVSKGIGRYVVALFGVEAQQPHLLGLQLLDEDGLGVADLDDGLLANGHQRFDGLGALPDALSGQLDGSLDVVAANGVLDQLGAEAGSHAAASALHPSQAEVVGVVVAAAASTDAVDQAAATLAAEDAAPQVVLVLLWSLASRALFIEPGLDKVEGGLVDQGLMAAWEGLFVLGAALVDDQAQVVRVAEHPLEGGRADFAFGITLGLARAQPEVIQLVRELRQRVFAGGVELEGVGDEVVAARVWDGSRDLATVGQLDQRPDVAQPTAAIAAATLGLLVEAATHRPAGLHRLVLVVDGHHALHVEGLRRVLADHRLGDGDQSGTSLAHQVVSAEVILDAARPATRRPDDHIVDAGGLVGVAALQLIEHVQKAGALVQIDKGALAGIAELADDLDIELEGLVFGGLTLGIDRQPVAAVAGLDLTFGRDAQVDEGALSCGGRRLVQ